MPYRETVVSMVVSLERGRASMRAGRFAEALRHFQATIDLDPASASAWYERAGALEAIGRLPEAIESFERARVLDPDGHGAIALFSIGNCYSDLGDLPHAIECFDQALAANPRLTRVWHNRGMALLKLDRLDEAAGSYAGAAELDPDNVRIRLWQGHCLQRLGRQREAEECFAHAVQTNAAQDVAQGWMQLSAHLQIGGAVEDALAACDRALVLWPAWDVAWHGRATCLTQMGRSDEALSAFDRAIALNGALRLHARSNKGALLMSLRRRREATAVYSQVLALAPASAQDHRVRAMALLALGRPEEALAALGLARRSSGDSPKPPTRLAGSLLSRPTTSPAG
jgi:tetratricopeptide (TPR) repeat protein